MQETNLNERSYSWALADIEDRPHTVPVADMRVAQVVGGCIGTGWKEIDDVVVVVVERDSERSQRKLVGDTVLGWATVAVSGSLNVQSMAGAMSGPTLSLKPFITGFVGKQMVYGGMSDREGCAELCGTEGNRLGQERVGLQIPGKLGTVAGQAATCQRREDVQEETVTTHIATTGL
jgi:hypothetical protein